MTLKLGAIADDFTGATDLALLISKAGYSVVQTIGVPDVEIELPKTDAIVIALKSRTNPVAEAVSQSLAAWAFLEARGVQQCFFKYCSTFDSTPKGNIGPVADALLDASGGEVAVACPSFPENGRTVYKGHLFVHDELLSDSPLRNHPLTPMTDANLVRVLSPQTVHKVGLADVATVEQGATHLSAGLNACAARDERLVIVDAIDERHLDVIGEAVLGHRLVTGGSAIAASLVRARLKNEEINATAEGTTATLPSGDSAILAGSCSEATLGQIRFAQERMPSLKLDVNAIAGDLFDLESVIAWAQEQLPSGPILIYTSETKAEREQKSHLLTPEVLGEKIEQTLAELIPRLVALGVRRFVVAGGETSGAVVSSLGVQYLRIGEQIDPGVPWTVTNGRSDERQAIALALKSGNFGSEDFFIKALNKLDHD